MARLTYLDRDKVEFIAHKLAASLFANSEDPLPAFQLLGTEGLYLLESALGVPRQPYYPTLHDKAGVLLRSLIVNHPLVDGNKRVGMTSTFVFLALNREFLLASNREMVDFALEIAQAGSGMSWETCADWVRERSHSTQLKAVSSRLKLIAAEMQADSVASGEHRLVLEGEAGILRRIGMRMEEYNTALSDVQNYLKDL